MKNVVVRTPAQDVLRHRFAKTLPIERLTAVQVNELRSFFKHAYADQPLATSFQDENVIAHRWRWLYESNPVPLDAGLPAWVCRWKDRIVGHVGVLPALAAAGGRAVPVGWVRDLIVAPEARGLGVGALLALHVMSSVRQSLLVGGMNDESFSLFGKLGFSNGGTLPLYVKVHDPSRMLATLQWSPLRRRLAATAIPAIQALRERVLAFGHRKERFEVEPVEHFDDGFDGWWAGVEPLFPSVMRRSAETMTWRYQRHPTHHYHVLAARKGKKLRGLVVLRHGRSRGVAAGFITELLANPDDRAVMDGLLEHAERWLTDTSEVRPTFLRCIVQHPAIEQALMRAGFLRAPSPIRWMVKCQERQAGADALQKRENWLLNSGDSDLDFF